MFWGCGLWVGGLGFGVWGLEFEALDLGFGIWGVGDKHLLVDKVRKLPPHLHTHHQNADVIFKRKLNENFSGNEVYQKISLTLRVKNVL